MSAAHTSNPSVRDFGNLRSLLHARPNAQRWDELCTLIDRWPCALDLARRILPYTCVTHKGLAALSKTPQNTRLRSLSIANLDLDNRAMSALHSGYLLDHLEHLNISRNAITDRGIDVLTSTRPKLAMRHIDLSFNTLTDASAFALAAAKNLPHIARLAIDYNDVGLAGWRALMHAPHLWRAEVSFYPVR